MDLSNRSFFLPHATLLWLLKFIPWTLSWGYSESEAGCFMLALMVLVYWVAWKVKMSTYTTALLVMAVFIFFNSVMFTSYLVWLVPFIPLVAFEVFSRSEFTELNQLD